MCDKILTEIIRRVECAKNLNENFAFLSGYVFVNMSTENLQNDEVKLARKYYRDLTAIESCQELTVFKKLVPLVIGIGKKTSVFDLLQHM